MRKRSYDASRRQAAAQFTRQAILDAAQSLFVSTGYSATRLRDIADRAGVSVPTVRAHFGTKPALLSTLVDVTIAGDDEPTALPERAFVDEINALATMVDKLHRYAAHHAPVLARLADIHLALQSAASADPEAATVWQKMADERRSGMAMFAAELMTTGEVRSDLGVDDVADVLWLAMDVGNYDWLVRRRGWSIEAFQEWYVTSVHGVLHARRLSTR